MPALGADLSALYTARDELPGCDPVVASLGSSHPRSISTEPGMLRRCKDTLVVAAHPTFLLVRAIAAKVAFCPFHRPRLLLELCCSLFFEKD